MCIGSPIAPRDRHGRDEHNFRWQLAETLSTRIPGARLHIIENEGHYSLPFRQASAILGAFRAAP